MWGKNEKFCTICSSFNVCVLFYCVCPFLFLKVGIPRAWICKHFLFIPNPHFSRRSTAHFDAIIVLLVVVVFTICRALIKRFFVLAFFVSTDCCSPCACESAVSTLCVITNPLLRSLSRLIATTIIESSYSGTVISCVRMCDAYIFFARPFVSSSKKISFRYDTIFLEHFSVSRERETQIVSPFLEGIINIFFKSRNISIRLVVACISLFHGFSLRFFLPLIVLHVFP